MKQILTIILATIIAVAGYAQSETLEQALTRITNLEATVNSQSQQLAKISSDLDAVLAQNLALKKNLKLTPTIAKAKLGEDKDVEYRIVEVKGDPSTNEIDIVMTAENLGNVDEKFSISEFEVIDELGNVYNDYNRCSLNVDGINDNLLFKTSLTYHPNAPLTMMFKITGYNPESKYIKYLRLTEGILSSKTHAVFQNLPINWEDGLDE